MVEKKVAWSASLAFFLLPLIFLISLNNNMKQYRLKEMKNKIKKERKHQIVFISEYGCDG